MILKNACSVLDLKAKSDDRPEGNMCGVEYERPPALSLRLFQSNKF